MGEVFNCRFSLSGTDSFFDSTSITIFRVEPPIVTRSEKGIDPYDCEGGQLIGAG